jgi:glycosyltransferase involved in cell wall biosynthesis
VKELKHIGLNIVFLEPGMGGMETYVRNLVPAMVGLRPDLRVSLFVNRSARPALAEEPWAGSVELVSHPALGRRYTRALSDLTILGRLAGSRGVDVLHSLGMTAPLRTSVVNVVTIPDLIWLQHPDSLSRLTTSLWRLVVPVVARRADRVITFSQASRDDIVRWLGVPEERVDVVLLGPGAGAGTKPAGEADVRARLDLGTGPVILAVSMKTRHKNLRRLIEAMATVRERHGDAILVLPGHHTAHEDELRSVAGDLGLDGSVRFCGWLPAADLEALYGSATCFVYPSLREGFGLPVLEAMRRGVPVACSDASSLPEVAGDAARYFEPTSTESIAEAVLDVLEDDGLRERLIAAGRKRQRQFSWRAAAEATLASYAQACEEHQ